MSTVSLGLVFYSVERNSLFYILREILPNRVGPLPTQRKSSPSTKEYRYSACRPMPTSLWCGTFAILPYDT